MINKKVRKAILHSILFIICILISTYAIAAENSYSDYHKKSVQEIISDFCKLELQHDFT